MRQITVVPMAERHLPALAEIERACFHAPWSENALREELGKGLFLVAEDQDQTVCGYVGCQTVLDEGYITNVAVSPDCRRQGIGRALIAELTEQAKRAGLAFVTSTPAQPYPGRACRRLRLEAMADQDLLRRCRPRLRFALKVSAALVEEAVDSLAQAKAMHDELEGLYHPYVDFGRGALEGERIAGEVLALA